MSQDWDYLIILDACRYDAFAEVADLGGNLKYAISKGSHSIEFCEKNFAGNEYYDTVYVTANGYGAQISQNVFYDLIFTDESDAVPEVDVLHSSSEGLAPRTVANAALDAYSKHPNKRMIIHFMQPHGPYLGSTAEDLRNRVADEGLKVIARDSENIKKYDTSNSNVVSTLGGAARKGYISNDELRSVYYENLEIALQYVRLLIDELNGKIVVTADHGELLGEHDTIGHPKYKYYKELRKVPWLVINTHNRPDIISDKPTESTMIDEAIVEDRLRALGYKTDSK
ncbi:sulfatase-like hydrolase/transferase [Halopenitus sp. POP-27]|uniref:sulfatase-like hydrolase/transferase n=1 Tax=Halopenitus sp. POP-27 TaxID=2994425 RepID=UPI00246905AE|nr:sulfatase-like hydrolase/transferase [Halopenitus sp. POP-27]